MNELTVEIELKGCNFTNDEYLRLDDMMEIEGFKRRNHPLDGRIQAANFIAHADILPRATYFGRSNRDESTLRNLLQSKVGSEVQSEVVVFVFGSAASAK